MPDIGGELLVLLITAFFMFVTGGIVKGTLGVGLPLVVVPLLSLLLDSSKAIGLLVMPVLVSNALQSIEGGRLIFTLRRFGTLIGAQEGNGEVNKDGPAESPAWRQRIEKARREIQEHQTECRIRVAAANIQQQQIENDIKEIKKWQNSLLLQSVAG